MASPAVNHLAKVRVAGSNPVVRSNVIPGQRPLRGPLSFPLWTPATGSATVRAMDCCSPTDARCLRPKDEPSDDVRLWCMICGAEYGLSWTEDLTLELVLVTPGRTEPAELRGILIPE